MNASLSVVIPTYGRGQVLIDTITSLWRLAPAALELIIVDQTSDHPPAIEAALGALAKDGAIRRLRLSAPSIPRAMNRGLLEAQGDIVLFLDDDIVPDSPLFAAHLAAHAAQTGRLVAGRVIQPWQEGLDFSADAAFHFASLRPAEIDQFMGGNFSISRADALAIGGFDENFVRVAYRFEAEFAHRWRKSGRAISYEPVACIHHLKAPGGGTRSFGDHLSTWSPAHSVGAYYCELRTWRGAHSLVDILARPLRAVATRFHLRRPWRIPATLVSEALGMGWAFLLAARGPSLIQGERRSSNV